MGNLRNAASAAIFVLFALSNQSLSAATVTYQYKEWNIGSGTPTGDVLGYLEFNSPPASATTGWSIDTTDESPLVSFTFNSNPNSHAVMAIQLRGMDFQNLVRVKILL